MKILHKLRFFSSILLIIACMFCLAACMTGTVKNSRKDEPSKYMGKWLEEAGLEMEQSAEELYQAALSEDTLTIYSVTSRVFDVKESFEKEYPGLTVEIKDVRSNDLVRLLKSNFENEDYSCDLVLCSNNDDSLYTDLIQPGIIYPYIPQDIKPMLKKGHADGELTFLGELLMLFYNGEVFSKSPIDNIWELTESKYKGKIIMANPLSSFSTYGFCATIISESEQIKAAYEKYKGEELDLPEEKSAGELFWELASPNIVFTNSSDDVVEGIGNSGKDGMLIGIMISSKMRLQEIGYSFEPIYRMEPFATVYTPNCVMMAGGAKSVNSAKLFIRYLLGEADGKGEGIKPYSTRGTWSVRTDVPDGNDVPLEQIDVAYIDSKYIHENRGYINRFFEKVLKENIEE